jgi:hypothetical protein
VLCTKEKGQRTGEAPGAQRHLRILANEVELLVLGHLEYTLHLSMTQFTMISKMAVSTMGGRCFGVISSRNQYKNM